MDEELKKELTELKEIVEDDLARMKKLQARRNKKSQEWSKWYGWASDGSLMYTALILDQFPETRNCLNRLILMYWRLIDGVKATDHLASIHPESITQVQTIIRARTKVIKKIKELGFTDPIQKERSRKGKGEPEPASGLQEDEVL